MVRRKKLTAKKSSNSTMLDAINNQEKQKTEELILREKDIKKTTEKLDI